ncbi:MAG: aminotransferase class IV [Bacteroidales bacterium]|nr:aminotransferase class IV [Bacteroidales bacterium]
MDDILMFPSVSGFDEWGPTYYHAKEYLPVNDAPLWRVNTSVSVGIYASEDMFLEGNEPTLWREHYLRFVEKAELIGLDKYRMPTSADIKRSIHVLANKNKYPPYSVVRLMAWEDSKGRVDYSIFQRRVESNIFEVQAEPIHLAPASKDLYISTGLSDKMGVNRIVVSLEHARAKKAGFVGACLCDSQHRILRSTLGALYFSFPGSKVVTVGEQTGGISDAIDKSLKEVFDAKHLKFEVVDNIDDSLLNMAHDCFVCSSTLGLRPVVSLGQNKRFFTSLSIDLAEELRKTFIF